MNGWVDKVNTELHYNFVTAMDAGMEVPAARILHTNDDIENANNDPGIEIISGMAVEKIVGPEITYHAFYKDKEFSCRTISIDDTKLLSGDQGPDIGDNATTVFCGSSRKFVDNVNQKPIEKIMDKLAEMAVEHDGDYTGFINVSVVYRDGVPYYRNILYGATYKFIKAVLNLYDGDINTFFNDPGCRDNRISSRPGFAISLRLYSYPYDLQNNKAIGDGLQGIEYDGESCFIIGQGATIKEAWNNLYSEIAPLTKRGVCYRNDAGLKSKQVFNDIMYRQYVER